MDQYQADHLETLVNRLERRWTAVRAYMDNGAYDVALHELHRLHAILDGDSLAPEESENAPA